MLRAHIHDVIPGRERPRANPESTIRSTVAYGFRVPAFGRPRNDEEGRR